jgi:NhaP-type Na+/H+ or K+/H+ antiporter
MEFISQVYAGVFEVPAPTLMAYFICVIIGVCINWIKQSMERGCPFKEYWSRFPVRSQLALFSTFAAFVVTAMTDPTSGKLTYVAIGFACDNLINKAPEDRKTKTKIDELVKLGNERLARIKELEETPPDERRTA